MTEITSPSSELLINQRYYWLKPIQPMDNGGLPEPRIIQFHVTGHSMPHFTGSLWYHEGNTENITSKYQIFGPIPHLKETLQKED